MISDLRNIGKVVFSMNRIKVGDLVAVNGHVAVVIGFHDGETLIKWASDGVVVAAENYSDLEVISESR